MCDCHEGAKSMFSDIKDLETKWDGCENGLFSFFFFFEKVSHVGWPQIHYVAEYDLELLIFLPWNYRSVSQSLAFWAAGDQTQLKEVMHQNPAGTGLET